MAITTKHSYKATTIVQSQSKHYPVGSIYPVGLNRGTFVCLDHQLDATNVNFMIIGHICQTLTVLFFVLLSPLLATFISRTRVPCVNIVLSWLLLLYAISKKCASIIVCSKHNLQYRTFRFVELLSHKSGQPADFSPPPPPILHGIPASEINRNSRRFMFNVLLLLYNFKF